jgi:tetratricopeptide (TPR) repeat protein
MARGYFYYYSARDYENALSEFYAALQTQPNNSDLFSAIAYVERRLGRWDESWEHLEKAVSLDPNNPEKVFEIRETARRMRKWESAEKYQKRFSAIRGGAAFGAEFVQYWISLDHHGDLEKLQAIHDDLNSRFSEYETIALRQWHKYITRDYKEGLAENIKLPFSDPFIRGNWYKLNGKTEEALAYYDTARVAAEARISENAEDWAAYTGLGLALAHLGKLDEAIKAGEKAVEIMPVHRDAWLGPQALDDLLNIYIECGEEVLAMDTIETLLSIPSDLTINRLKLMGIFDPLRDKPRFQRLLQVQS